ncbi:MAG: hypothetical protein PHW04_00985 [Candidatus Wallbacteria bacterium]|nr:hypothetical protein [Candidatus Wallbacteria bacterium]
MSVTLSVKLSVEDIAESILKLDGSDREMLLLLLSGEKKEIRKRLSEIKSGKIKAVHRSRIFN